MLCCLDERASHTFFIQQILKKKKEILRTKEMIIFSTLQDALLYHYKMLLRTYSMLFIISTQHNEDTALNLEYEIMSKVPPFLVLNQKQNQLQIILIYLSFTKVKAAKLVRLDLIIFSPKY